MEKPKKRTGIWRHRNQEGITFDDISQSLKLNIEVISFPYMVLNIMHPSGPAGREGLI